MLLILFCNFVLELLVLHVELIHVVLEPQIFFLVHVEHVVWTTLQNLPNQLCNLSSPSIYNHPLLLEFRMILPNDLSKLLMRKLVHFINTEFQSGLGLDR
jgi:hypothetical protein